jgi:hypothetical protein
MNTNLLKPFLIPVVVCSLTGCPTSGTFTPNLENYTGADASVLYLYSGPKQEYVLVTYMFNNEDSCYEKMNSEQLTTLGMFVREDTPELRKYTIKPGRNYALKIITYDINRTFVSSHSFIPEAKKTYYFNNSMIITTPDNPTKEYLGTLSNMEHNKVNPLPTPKFWDIKNRTCKNLITGPL